MAYESSNFIINRVDLSVDNPMAEQSFDILIDFENAGNKEGQFEIQIVISISGVFQSPVTETSDVCNAKSDCGLWRIEVQPFPEAATNVSIVIKNMDGEEIDSIPAFNVAKYSAEESDSGSMLLVGIIGVVLVLIVAVVVVYSFSTARSKMMSWSTSKRTTSSRLHNRSHRFEAEVHPVRREAEVLLVHLVVRLEPQLQRARWTSPRRSSPSGTKQPFRNTSIRVGMSSNSKSGLLVKNEVE